MTTAPAAGMSPRPVTEAGHACWSYDDLRPFDARARAFLGEGLAAGELLWYVPGRRTTATVGWLRGVAATAAGRPGAVRILTPADAYGGAAATDPAGQVAAHAAATEEALADGFTGLRVVADVTGLVRTDEHREAFARFEFMAGQYMRNAPMRSLCAYDRLELGDRAVAELACLHETSHADGVAFHLHPGPTADTAVLDGDLDLSAEGLFAVALRYTGLEPVGGEVTVDAHGLRFIDHRSLLTLQRYAQSRGFTAVVRTRLGIAARVADLLDLSNVRVEIVR